MRAETLKCGILAWLLVLTAGLVVWCMSLQDRVDALSREAGTVTSRLHGIASQLGRIESLMREHGK